jgi:hypothetical protein
VSVIYIINIFISFGGNLVYLLGVFKYINLDTNFKLDKDKKDYSIYLDIKLEELRDTL